MRFSPHAYLVLHFRTRTFVSSFSRRLRVPDRLNPPFSSFHPSWDRHPLRADPINIRELFPRVSPPPPGCMGTVGFPPQNLSLVRPKSLHSPFSRSMTLS